MRKGKKVLSLWASIGLVFAGMIVVAGATALGLLLSGMFDDKVVYPEDISLSLDTENDNMAYTAENGQLYVAENFQIVVDTTTEDVTEKKITLSLTDKTDEYDGKITNGIIEIPKEWVIGKPFDVVVKKDYTSTLGRDVAVGGTTVIKATSENVMKRPVEITINVDVPVEQIEASINGQTGKAQSVVVGSEFTVDVAFTPEKGQYIFANSEKNKEVFFDYSRTFISYNWETGKFTANKSSGIETDTIKAYTFSNSYYRWQILERFKDLADDPEELNDALIGYFSTNPLACVEPYELNVQVKDVDLDASKVKVGVENTTLKTIYVDKDYRLTTVSSTGDATLELDVRDINGVQLTGMLGNFGILMPEAKGLVVTGGRVVKVDKSSGAAVLSEEDYDAKKDYSLTDAVSYYLLPNNKVAEAKDYYWQFEATQAAGTLELRINFFYEDAQGKLVNLFEFSDDEEKGERKVSVSVIEHDYEEDPSWSTATIKLDITYKDNGEPNFAEEHLSEYLNKINENNVYKTVKYFLLFDADENVDAQTINTVFPNKGGKLYKTDYRGNTIGILDTPTDNGYMLYELNGDTLIATRSFAKSAKVIAATIRTHADKTTPYYTSNGAYQIVNVSTPKMVTVESALSIKNMQTGFFFADGVEADANGEYYIPAINRNDSYAQKTMIKMQLNLKSDNFEGDQEKLEQAYRDDKLYVECYDITGTKIDNFVTMDGLKKVKAEGNVITFESDLTISEQEFSNLYKENRYKLDLGTHIKLKLIYDDGKEKFPQQIVYVDDMVKAEEENRLDHFNIYYQQPVEIVGAYKESLAELDLDKDGLADKISVSITSEGMKVVWGSKTFEGKAETVIGELNKLLSFKLVDQFGQEIDGFADLYTVRFVEETAVGGEASTSVLEFDTKLESLQTIPSTKGKSVTTYLSVYVVDKVDDSLIYTFDNNVATQTFLATERFEFDIVSEGVEKVLRDPSNFVGSTDPLIENIVNGKMNTGTVKVSKFVTAGNTITLKDHLAVYKQDATEQEKLIIKLDSDYVGNLSPSAKEDLMKMIAFNSVGDKYETKTIDQWLSEELTNMVILKPFEENTTIKFSVTDENGALFSILYEFECLKDVTATPNFEKYYSANSTFLVNSNNDLTPGVFGGMEYDLDEFTNFSPKTNNAYSWAAALKGLDLTSSATGVFYNGGSDICTLEERVDAKTGESKIILKIADVYKFQTVNLTVYYGVNSSYALQAQYTLYVNPNIIMKEEVSGLTGKPYLDLSGIATDNAYIKSFYKFYKATDYIASGSFDGLTEISMTGLTFANTSSTRYLGVTGTNAAGTATADYYFCFGTAEELYLKLGETFEQSFAVEKDNEAFNVIKMKVAQDGQKSIEKSDVQTGLAFTILAGYGTTIDAIITNNDGSSVETVSYGTSAEQYMLMVSGEKYSPRTGFTIEEAVGFMDKTGNAITAKTLTSSFVSATGNYLKISAVLQDKTSKSLTVVVDINVIVSALGDKFVCYNNGELPDTASGLEFNVFGDCTFDTLIGSLERLEAFDVYQQLLAGQQYKVVHAVGDISSDFDSKQVYGFYYESSDTPNISWDIVSGGDYAKKVYVDASDKIGQLYINHLENSVTAQHIVLKIRIVSTKATYEGYYRIRIVPSFEKGNVEYPYASADEGVAEYIDSSSLYYDAAVEYQYVINLEEEFTAQNSANKTGTRFVAPTFNTGVTAEDISATYEISKVFVNGTQMTNYGSYITYDAESLTNGILAISLTDSTQKVTIEITKTHFVAGGELIGGDLTYTFNFNQSSNYIPTLTNAKVDDEGSIIGDGVTLTKIDDTTFAATIPADSGKYLFTSTISIKTNNTTAPVTDYEYYVVDEASAVTVTGDSASQITIQPAESVDSDKTVEIGFYTSQKRVFKLVLTITSYYKIEIGEGFVGGETYHFGGTDETKLFKTLDILNNDGNKTIIGVQVENTDTDDVKLNDISINTLFKITEGTTWDGSTIEFAHLTADTTFNFRATITAEHTETDEATGEETTATTYYSFNFSIAVKASFNNTESNIYREKASQYGGKEVTLSVENVATQIAKFTNVGSTEFMFVTGTDGDGVEIYASEVKFTPDNVASTTTADRTYTIKSLFNSGKETVVVFESSLVYAYTIEKNVNLEENYPMPDGISESAVEYIATTLSDGTYKSATISEFFGSNADFSSKARVEATTVAAAGDITQAWTINVSNISNVNLTANGKIITETSSDKNILRHVAAGSEAFDVSLVFELVNAESEGSVDFEIIVNQVSTTYKVVVVAGSVISIEQNAPTYENAKETIYAEDLKQQSEAKIFASNRILQYAFKSSVAAGSTYWLRFENAGTYEIIEISATGSNTLTNIDLGKSLQGFTYQAAYTTETLAKEKDSEGVKAEADIFETAPRLTARIEAKYADGKRVLLGANANLKLLKVDNTDAASTTSANYVNASEITLSEEDFQKDVTYKIGIGYGSDPIIETGSVYNVYLTVDFTVSGNADSVTTRTYVEVDADQQFVSLLDYYRGFGIKSVKNNAYYTKDMVEDSGAKLSLKIYGFDDMKIENSETDSLTKTAYDIHNELSSTLQTVDEKQIKYASGLTPRAGQTLSDGSVGTAGDVTKNYLTISGATHSTDETDVDYLIRAQGASNDGNFVMMRLTYIVEISSGFTVEKSHNLLFKVMPKSAMTFSEGISSTAGTNGGDDDLVVEGQSIMSNKNAPYKIVCEGTGPYTFNLWNNSNTGSKSAIVAHMYGNESTNVASTFTYKNIVKLTTASDYTGTKVESADKLSITFDQLDLGEEEFYIDFENDYGYKARFYITVTGELNPQINTMRSFTLTEGESLAVGTRFQIVNQTKSTNGVMYDIFTYDKENDVLSISLVANNDVDEASSSKTNAKIGNVRITATLTGGTQAVTLDGNDEIKQVMAGDVVFRDEIWTGGNININGSGTGWKLQHADKSEGYAIITPIVGDTLAGAQIRLEISVSKNKTDDSDTPASLATYTVKYGTGSGDLFEAKETLTQTYVAGEYGALSEAMSNVSNYVELRGIDAYAFNNDYLAIDTNSAKEYGMISNLNNIKVKYVDFYYQDTWIGGSNVEGTYRSTSGRGSAKTASLITSSTYSYVVAEDGDYKLYNGENYNSDNHTFTVPYINGILFGTGRELANVQMKITITDNFNHISVLTQTVTIKKERTTDYFASTKIADDTSPVTNAAYASGSLLNDTLEVTLRPNETVSFIVHNADLASAAKNETDGNWYIGSTQLKLITLTNEKIYNITEYVSITNSMSDGILTKNLSSGSQFFIKVVSDTIKNGDEETKVDSIIAYNGGDVKIDSTGNSISGYSGGLQLRVENVAELNSSRYKKETLYFLDYYNIDAVMDGNGNKVYQVKQDFEVYPIFKSATATGVQVNGDILVEDYYTMTNGTDSYYVIPLAVWGEKVELGNYVSDVKQTLAASAGEAYKFVFEINTSSSGGAGSAFIDENGLITTTSNFNIQTHTITVNVYVKVSGYDGNYGGDDKSLSLVSSSTIRLALANRENSTETGTAGESYVIEGNIITIPSDWTMKYTSDVATSSILSYDDSDKTYAFTVGETANFHEMFDDLSVVAGMTNINYHLVKIDDAAVYFNNLNSHTFTTAGSYTLSVVATGRKSGAYTTAAFTAEVIVYTTNTQESKFVTIKESTSGTTTYDLSKFATDATWFELSADGSIMPIESNEGVDNVTLAVGYSEKTYLARTTDGEAKVYDVEFYVYNDIIEKAVGIGREAQFDMQNLIDNKTEGSTYKFFKFTGETAKSPVVLEQFLNIGVGTIIADNEYYMVETKADGTTAVTKFVVDFKVIPDGTDSTSIYIQKTTTTGGDLTINAGGITETINALLGTDGTIPFVTEIDSTNSNAFIMVEERSTSGVLTMWDTSSTVTAPEGTTNYFTKNLLISYRLKEGGVIAFRRVAIKLYLYEEAKTLFTERDATTSFELSNLDAEVKTLVGGSADNSVAYFQINESRNELERKYTASLQMEDHTGTYYVLVGEKYYLINLTIAIAGDEVSE